MITRDRQVLGVSLAILVANLAVATAKLIYGVRLGSIGIQADAFHSYLDGINNVVIIVAVSVASRRADANHPYGHRKFEVLASLFIGFMFAVMITRTVTSAWNAFRGEAHLIAADAYTVILATIGVNVVVTTLEHIAGRRLRSELLVADARHTLSDVFVSVSVLIGVAGNRFGISWADAASALVIAVVVAWIGYGIVKNAIAGLVDEAALPAEEVLGIAQTVVGVLRVGRVRSRRYGESVSIDMTIAVEGAQSLDAAHGIADRVEAALARRWPQATDIVVHVEPSKVAGGGEQ